MGAAQQAARKSPGRDTSGSPPSAPVADPPGQGINRRRPRLLAAALLVWAAWLVYLVVVGEKPILP